MLANNTRREEWFLATSGGLEALTSTGQRLDNILSVSLAENDEHIYIYMYMYAQAPPHELPFRCCCNVSSSVINSTHVKGNYSAYLRG